MTKKKFNVIEEGRFLTDEKLNNVTGGNTGWVICGQANTYRNCPTTQTLTNCSNIYDVTECARYVQCGVLYQNCGNFPTNHFACPGTQGYYH